MYENSLIWVAIAICVSQSAIFSGLNLAFFTLSRLRLEVEASSGDADAVSLLRLRSDPNLLLTTVLVGNVATNVLLTLLSDSVLAGVSAFLFSTVAITVIGEILPQAYFSRNALRVASFLSPVFHVYRVLLYPVTKPLAMLLDRWLGPEGLTYFREGQLRTLIRKHINVREAEIDRIEGLGALNFLALDDLFVGQEGEPIRQDSIVALQFTGDTPEFPRYEVDPADNFLSAIQASGKKWVVLVDAQSEPRLVIDADSFLRAAFFSEQPVDPMNYCHRPIVLKDASARLGAVLSGWTVKSEYPGDNVIDNDLVLLWTGTRRIITGADILGRLLEGISRPLAAPT